MDIIEIDKEFEIKKYSKVCSFCANLINNGLNRKCKAFPTGIPMDIWAGDNKHIERHSGQKNDILFEASE